MNSPTYCEMREALSKLWAVESEHGLNVAAQELAEVVQDWREDAKEMLRRTIRRFKEGFRRVKELDEEALRAKELDRSDLGTLATTVAKIAMVDAVVPWPCWWCDACARANWASNSDSIGHHTTLRCSHCDAEYQITRVACTYSPVLQPLKKKNPGA